MALTHTNMTYMFTAAYIFGSPLSLEAKGETRA